MTNFQDKFDNCFRARVAVLWVQTLDEDRVIGELKQWCQTKKEEIKGKERGKGKNKSSVEVNIGLICWNIADGFSGGSIKEGTYAGSVGPDVLKEIEKISTDMNIVVLKDYHLPLEQNPITLRKLRNLSVSLRKSLTSIVITSNTLPPQGMEDSIQMIDYPLLSKSDISDIFSNLVDESTVTITGDNIKGAIVEAAAGLSENQTHRAIAEAVTSVIKDSSSKVVKDKLVLNKHAVELIRETKAQTIKSSGALELIRTIETEETVGGLHALKKWIRIRGKAFSKEASEYGLPRVKGLALIGVPGNGKSLTAKMVASTWNLPLIKFDMGALFGSLIGQSEKNTRHALKLVDTAAPCVCWLDEMEKALQAGGKDGGTSQRVLQTILTWMQERTADVFVIGTANRIELIPPELLRRGRFDEVFFLDIPTEEERRAIFNVHIKKNGRNPDKFDIGELALCSTGFVGSEIEQAVIDAMYNAFYDNGREVTQNDVLYAIENIVPLSISKREEINELRTWVKEGRARNASLIQEIQEQVVLKEPAKQQVFN